LNSHSAAGWHIHCSNQRRLPSAKTGGGMLADIYYITKFLQVSAAIGFAAGATLLIAPGMEPADQAPRPRPSVERKQVRALPVTLPQGRLYCVEGVVMHQRMYPRGLERISPADAVEIASTIADEACERSLRSSGCKAAQADLTSLRRALRSCQG
jgi:hypothetical protein